MDNLLVIGSYIFGLVLVIFFAIQEFNAPEYNYHDNDDSNLTNKYSYAKLAEPILPRYMADKSRYNIFMTMFIAISALVYFGFAKLLLIIPGVDLVIGKQNEALAAVLSALLLVGVVKSDDIGSKKIQFLLKWPKTVVFVLWKNMIHNYAYIPGLSCKIFNALCYEELDLDSEVVKKNIHELLNRKYRDDFNVNQYIEFNDYKNIGSPTGMIARWARLSYFIFVVDKWSRDPKFMNQVSERSLGWGALEKAGYIPLIEKMAAFRDKSLSMSQEEEDKLSKQVDHLLANCYRLIACIVVMTARPSENPMSYVKQVGLKVYSSKRMYSKQGEIFRVIFAILPTITIVAIIYTFIGSSSGPAQTILNILSYIAYAGIIMIFPVILVFALKCHMALSNTWPVVTVDNPYESFFDMPLIIYSMISALAWFISLLSMMVFMNGKNMITIDLLEWKSAAIFCIISAITAFITCYRSDIPPRVYKTSFKRGLFVLGCSGVHGGLTALIVWVGLTLSEKKELAPELLWQFPLLGFFIALAIGVTLFHGKHKTEQRNLSNRTPCNKPVTIAQGGYQVPAVILNKSSTGVMLVFTQAMSMIQDNKAIEIIFDGGLKKIGIIVKRDTKQLHVSYQS